MSTATKGVASAPTKVRTGKVRFSYLNVFEPKAVQEGADKKYSVSLIIPKKNKALLAKIKEAIDLATENGKKLWGGKIPAKLKLPLRDGDVDRDEDDNYANCMFINASAKTQPGLVYKDEDGALVKITDSTKMYSGCYGDASINFYPFKKGGSVGIACGLNNLLFLEDGEPLGGRSRAEDDFADDENSDY